MILTIYSCDHRHAQTQMNDFGVETHLGGGVMSAFVILLAAITQGASFIFHYCHVCHQ